jgi:hypothetical protein
MSTAPTLPPEIERVRWLLEFTFDGEEKGCAVYESEAGCRLAAATDGGTVVGLVRETDATAHAAALAQRVAELERENERLRPPEGFVIDGYRLGSGIDCITVERAQQMFGPDLWAVRKPGRCLNKSGEWEYEPMPSSRDDDFMARCRFATAEEAIDAARKGDQQHG